MNRGNKKHSHRYARWILLGGAVAAGWVVLAPVESLNAAIQGSKHDFSALSEKQEICVFCHTPHDANDSVTEAPLWNRETSTKQFRLYNSPTLDAEVEQPSGTSKLCLSCHDGTVAIDSYGGNLGGKQVRSEAAIAGDALQLANDHPISFVYDDSLAARDGELFPPSSAPSGLGKTIREDLLFNDRVECSSCHDVHNGPVAAGINDHLLVITQSQSRLCLTCHDK
jgi:predicted CXXCH cytochrome family protein